MYNVRTNPIKNRLYITLREWDQADIKMFIKEIENACRCLIPGFTCLTVLNKKGQLHQSDKDLLFSAADLVYTYGASKIVQVRSNGDKSVFFHSSPMGFQTDFTVHNAENIQEAEEILDRNNSREELAAWSV